MAGARCCVKRGYRDNRCMKRIIPTLSDAEAVLALRAAGSFRGAASAMGLSPSALSRQIAALEARLGARLFDRDTRNVALTPSGEVFATAAERIVFAAEDAMADFEAHRTARHGVLTIAGLPSVTAGLLPALLRSFSDAHPQIDLRIHDALSGGVLEAVESGHADLGFAAGTVSARRRLSFQPLMDDPFVAVGAPGGPLAADRPYALRELVEMPFVAMAQGTSVRELLDGACLRIGHALAPRFEVAHLATAGALVAAGMGVTALPTLTLPVLRAEALIRREIPDFGLRRRIGLVRRADRSPSPAAAAFLKHARSALGGASAG